jgi:hypothetical protein
MSGTTAIASLPNNTHQLNNNVGINISEKIPQQNTINSQIQLQNIMNESSNSNILSQIQQPQQMQQPQQPQQIQQIQQPQQMQQMQQSQQMQSQYQMQPPEQMQQEMNTLVSNLQQAGASGGTALPSRDIPTNTSHLAIDNNIQQNNISTNQTVDYLKHTPNIDTIINQSITQKNKLDNYHILLEELQLPLLAALLFLLYHIPISKQFLKQNLPFIYNNEHNITLKGNITLSILFGMTYYIGTKLLDKI